jgi:hypothetical protein
LLGFRQANHDDLPMRLFALIREWLRRNDSRHVPGIVKSRGNMAYSFIQQGEYLAARDQPLTALERRYDIRDPSVSNWLLELLWWTWTFTEQYRESTEFFSTYVERYPEDARGYSLRASVVRSKPAIRGNFKTGHMARDLDVVLCRSLSLQV